MLRKPISSNTLEVEMAISDVSTSGIPNTYESKAIKMNTKGFRKLLYLAVLLISGVSMSAMVVSIMYDGFNLVSLMVFTMV